VRKAEFELSSILTTACLTLIWQYGNQHCHIKKWEEATDWFFAGRLNPSILSPKCFHKAAFYIISSNETMSGHPVIRQCPSDASTTHYVIFVAAVHQYSLCGLATRLSRRFMRCWRLQTSTARCYS
ncbi:hypothetical protein BD779DRAFT_1443630, partial [Infundibulicybe gibba]